MLNRRRVLAVTTLTVLTALGITAATKHDRKLIVLAGQSNAVGFRSDAGLLPKSTPNVPFWWNEPGQSSSEMKWGNLTPQPGEFEKGHFGPEFGIARTMADASVFKYSSGSTSLAKDWRPQTDDGFLRQLLDELNIAMQDTPAKPYCFVFVQGESDAQPDTVEAYRSNLTALIDRVRQKLGTDIAIVLSVDELHPYVQRFPQVVAIQKETANADPKIEFSSFSDLPKYDETHLVAASTLTQGKRLAEACEALQ